MKLIKGKLDRVNDWMYLTEPVFKNGRQITGAYYYMTKYQELV